MKWNWTQQGWPEFRFDASRLEPLERQFQADLLRADHPGSATDDIASGRLLPRQGAIL
ncbi:DUF4172 domain-containing protein [Ensifer adhaerens]|nr:DUF4172 domain-containing protein [Ensifer canadensis]